jgi:hypothetical protein
LEQLNLALEFVVWSSVRSVFKQALMSSIGRQRERGVLVGLACGRRLEEAHDAGAHSLLAKAPHPGASLLDGPPMP